MGWKLALGVLLIGIPSFGEDTNQLKTVEKGAFSGIQEPMQVIVTNKTQWAKLWEKHNAQKLPKQPPPEIDFSKESLLFVSAGRKNTGGYSIEISEVRRSGENAEVFVTTKGPKPGGFNIQALTAPFQIVTVPRIQGEVKFKIENKGG